MDGYFGRRRPKKRWGWTVWSMTYCVWIVSNLYFSYVSLDVKLKPRFIQCKTLCIGKMYALDLHVKPKESLTDTILTFIHMHVFKYFFSERHSWRHEIGIHTVLLMDKI